MIWKGDCHNIVDFKRVSDSNMLTKREYTGIFTESRSKSNGKALHRWSAFYACGPGVQGSPALMWTLTWDVHIVTCTSTEKGGNLHKSESGNRQTNKQYAPLFLLIW